MRNRPTILILAALPLAGLLQANWPQWRGPNRNGSASTAHGLPINWSETDSVVWRTKLPSWSAATPIVWADTIFITSAEEGSPTLDRGRRRGSSESVPDKIFL